MENNTVIEYKKMKIKNFDLFPHKKGVNPNYLLFSLLLNLDENDDLIYKKVIDDLIYIDNINKFILLDIKDFFYFNIYSFYFKGVFPHYNFFPEETSVHNFKLTDRDISILDKKFVEENYYNLKLSINNRWNLIYFELLLNIKLIKGSKTIEELKKYLLDGFLFKDFIYLFYNFSRDIAIILDKIIDNSKKIENFIENKKFYDYVDHSISKIIDDIELYIIKFIKEPKIREGNFYGKYNCFEYDYSSFEEDNNYKYQNYKLLFWKECVLKLKNIKEAEYILKGGYDLFIRNGYYQPTEDYDTGEILNDQYDSIVQDIYSIVELNEIDNFILERFEYFVYQLVIESNNS